MDMSRPKMTPEQLRERRAFFKKRYLSDPVNRRKAQDTENAYKRKRRAADPAYGERRYAWQKAYLESKKDDPEFQKNKKATLKRWLAKQYREAQLADPEFNFKRRCFRHGITTEAFWDIFNFQGGCCAICDSLFPDPVKCKSTEICIDHDHALLKVRGLLCNGCNAAVGMLGDTPQGVLRALEYLDEPAGFVLGYL